MFLHSILQYCVFVCMHLTQICMFSSWLSVGVLLLLFVYITPSWADLGLLLSLCSN